MRTEKIYYGIGEVSQETGMSGSAIGFYVLQTGMQVKIASRGVRKFTVLDINQIRLIKKFSEAGMSVKMITAVIRDKMACELAQMLVARLEK
jgi:DNA-binding transcriptional MerR regulator